MAALEHAGCQFCVEALNEAIAEYGKPEFMNTDQRSQFTSSDWIDELKAAKVQILMDGKAVGSTTA